MIDFFDIQVMSQDDAWWFLATPKTGCEGVIVVKTAERIAHQLIGHIPDLLESWITRRDGGQSHTPSCKASLEAFLMSDFEEVANETRIQGAVVEHLWAILAVELEGGWGKPLHVEHDHFSVIDHGGDGLTIYELGAPDLRFRLWETKRHDASSSITSVITNAAGQIKEDGTRYLARMTKVLQTHGDSRIENLSGRMVDLWSERSSAGGVGVSVGTTTPATDLPSRPFRGLSRLFANYPGPEHREGLIIQIADLQGLALQVRDQLLTGID